MSLSVQRSVVELFKFNDKNIRVVHIKNVGQCFVSKDVYETIGYEEESGKKAIQRLILEKYKIRPGGAAIDMKEAGIRLYRDTVLLAGNGLKLFLMRCCKPKAFDVAKHFGIKIEHRLPASKEQDALSQIMQVFRGEKMIHQFGTRKYRIDLYFPKLNWLLNTMSLVIKIETLNMK